MKPLNAEERLVLETLQEAIGTIDRLDRARASAENRQLDIALRLAKCARETLTQAARRIREGA